MVCIHRHPANLAEMKTFFFRGLKKPKVQQGWCDEYTRSSHIPETTVWRCKPGVCFESIPKKSMIIDSASVVACKSFYRRMQPVMLCGLKKVHTIIWQPFPFPPIDLSWRARWAF